MINQEDLKIRVALLEDDTVTGNVLNESLVAQGFRVDWFVRGIDCVRAIQKYRYDICILDWILPDIDGPEVMSLTNRNRKKNSTPIIFVTSKVSESDMVAMLNAGADDYIVKPVHVDAFLARVNALLRRAGHGMDNRILKWGSIELDLENRRIYMNGEIVDLTETERELAIYMFENTGRLVTRDALLKSVWKTTANIGTRKIDVHMSRVKRKLQWNMENRWNLSSIYGLGYRLEWFSK